jgi:hypothetical protein
MARAVYSLRIFATGALSPGAGTVGPIVPAGLVYVVRDIDAFDDTAGASDNLIVFNQLSGVLISWQGPSLAANGNYSWRGRQVYNEGEQVAFRAFVGTWAIACSGYQLTLP